MRKLILFIILMCPIMVMAQKVSVTGKVSDKTSGELLPGASAVLLSVKDSSIVSGATTASTGKFQIPAVSAGQYILRITYMSYKTLYKNLTLTRKTSTYDLGNIGLAEDSKLMKEATVTGKLAQVEMKADTFVYNADAYRLPEGAVLEDLVKKLPGAEVGSDGKITVNGKEVKKIMVEGKEFFDNDTKLSMKNLPTKMINKIKAYDRKSDYSRVTGIDDGEEETVLDLQVKKGMKEGWLINLDGAYGTHNRYAVNANVNRFMDNYQVSLIVNANNANTGMPGGGGGMGGRGGGGGGGITATQMAGLNFAWENGKKDYTAGCLKMGGNVRFYRSSTDNLTTTNTQNFLTGSSTWGNSSSMGNTIAWNLNANYRLEWMPDSLTNIMFRPNFSHSDNSSNSSSESVTFDADPYGEGQMTDPLSQYDDAEYKTCVLVEPDSIGQKFLDKHLINRNISESLSNSYSNSVDASLQINRQLGKAGRNITLNLKGGYSDTHSKSLNLNDIKYYQEASSSQSQITKRYSTQPSTSWNIQPRLSYTEPITKHLNLQFSYQFQYRFSDSSNEINDLDIDKLRTLLQQYSSTDYSYLTDAQLAEKIYLNNLPGVDINQILILNENSKYATYNEYNHNTQMMLRYTNKFENGQELRFNAGISFQPQSTDLKYKKQGIDTLVHRSTFNWAPRVDVRWRINQTSQLNLRYNGSMTQPSMTNMIEVMDNTNPQNVSIGNAGLLSSWSNRFNLFYNQYITDKQMGWSVNAGWSQTSRSTSSASITDKTTNNKYTRPMNIDGNWSANGNLMFNTAIGKAKAFNVSTNTSLSYSNNVGFTSSRENIPELMELAGRKKQLPQSTEDMAALFSYVDANGRLNKATTKTFNIGETLRANYRGDWGTTGSYEFGLNGGFNYQHSRNDQQTNANLDTWSFNYGGSFTVTAPWGTSLSMDCGPEYRRGYSDESMNTTEIIWNAQLSQSFLKGNALTISAQWYDILQERSNISRSISATMRSDTWTNAINSYCMFHIIYRLNLLGNKEARNAMRHGPGDGMMPPDGMGPGGDRSGKGGNGGDRGNRGGGMPMGGGFGGPGGGGGRM